MKVLLIIVTLSVLLSKTLIKQTFFIMEKQNYDTENVYNAFEIKRSNSVESVSNRNIKKSKIWRSSSLFNFVNKRRKNSNSTVLFSQKTIGSQKEEMLDEKKSVSALSIVPRTSEKKDFKSVGNHKSIVTIVLVKAKSLPSVPEDGTMHTLYCKFRLGLDTYKSKAVASTVHPEWRERFKLHLHTDELLKISIWDKGKQKNFMGSCVLDLSSLEAERTHQIWQQLDDGYGLLHLSVTLCSTRSNTSSSSCLFNVQDFQQRHAVFNMTGNWEMVGSLHVNVLGARGLAGKPSAYCTLEVDNERVQTPQEKASSEPRWNKCYVFKVYDITSTLDLKVHDGSFLNESLGKVSIPLLRIVNGQIRWYALKDRSKRNIAKGNYPRVCLQITLIWNPIKASIRLFRPRQIKYVKKPPKFDLALLYSNLEFIQDVFNFLYALNEAYKQSFEWDDPETSFVALICWLVFCTYLQLWTVPLLLLLPFLFHWFTNRHQDSNRYNITRVHSNPVEGTKYDKSKEEKSFTGKLQDLQIMTLTITGGVEYLASVVERLYNLVSYKVPFLSFLTMILLVVSSFVLYFIPFNYLLMLLGIYKFTRKYLNPDRVLNNDLLDFISRIPDNEILKDWKELSVPEPVLRQSSLNLARSISCETSEVAIKSTDTRFLTDQLTTK